jgi:uncharacterized protein (TIGR03437 family)
MSAAKILILIALPLMLAQAAAAGRVRRFAALPAGDAIADAALDSSGHVIVVGAFDPAEPGGEADSRDAFAAKLSPDGSQLLYRHVFAGAGADRAQAAAIDSQGAVYVTISTSSPDLTGTPGALQPMRGSEGYQTLVAKLDPEGVLVYQTYVGGASGAAVVHIAVNGAGEALLSGQSGGAAFPFTPGTTAPDGATNTEFVAKLDNTGSELLIGLRGIGGGPVAFDPDGDIYVAGGSFNTNAIPLTPGAFQPTHPIRGCGGTVWLGIPCRYGYVVKLRSDGTEALYGTFLAGSFGSSIAALSPGRDGTLLVAGSTSSPDFPTTRGALLETYVADKPYPPIPVTPHAPVYPPPQSGFVAQLNANGSDLIFSTYFSGAVQDSIAGMVRGERSIVLTGVAESGDLPGLGAPAPCLPAVYVAEIALDGSAALSATLLNDPLVPHLGLREDALLAAAGSDILEIDPAAPQPRIRCVLDAPTFSRTGRIAPGSLLSLFGAELAEETLVGEPDEGGLLPAALGSLSVFVGERSAPLLYVSPDQVNLQVPYEIEPGTQAEIRLAYRTAGEEDDAAREASVLSVEARSPAVFISPLHETLCPQLQPLQGGSGVSPLALNEDGTIVECANPAKPGSIVTIFLAGVGRSEPPQTTGARFQTPAVPLTLPVTLGNVEVLSASSLPGSISSVWQVRLRVPGDIGRVLSLEPAIDGVPAVPGRLFLWVGR